MYKGKKYKASATELKKICNLALQENGDEAMKDEISLMCNLMDKYGSRYKSIYDYIRNGGWFYKAAYYMDQNISSGTQVAIAQDIICNGNRTLPLYIDEHDCLADIITVSNYGISFNKKDRSQYIKNVTKVKQNPDKFKGGGITWTFYCFPSPYSDPFGYTVKGKDEKKETEEIFMCIGNHVNFRTGPGTNYKILGQLDEGDLITITRQSGAWYKGIFDGKEGYIYSKYILNVEDTVENLYGTLKITYSDDELKVLIKALNKKLGN